MVIKKVENSKRKKSILSVVFPPKPSEGDILVTFQGIKKFKKGKWIDD